jgi:hypothetical protein
MFMNTGVEIFQFRYENTVELSKRNVMSPTFFQISDSVLSLLDMDGAYFHESIDWFDS